ncbi:MAG: bacteriohemerythrin [Turneriella sp.]
MVTKAYSPFVWDNRYATGIEIIDSQHKRLFGLTNQMLQAAAENAKNSVLAELLAQIEEYASTHFSHEESIMEWAGYKNLAEHREQHGLLREELDYFAAELEKGALTPHELAEFMQSWLAKHIIHEDMKYLPAVKKKQNA